MELCFNVEGNFITELARQQFYKENVSYKKVKQLLLSCMCGTEMSLKTLETLADDILKFKRKFVGNTNENTFCLVEDNTVPKDKDIQIILKNFDYFKENGEIPFKNCEYGFIRPDGKYIPVSWCKHGEWADNYLKENFSEEECFKLMANAKGEINNRICSLGTDVLVNKLNWILIDNPYQEEGIIQTGSRITKAQKETLYDYLMFFGRKDEANKLFEEVE